jgi:hypothetical protein
LALEAFFGFIALSISFLQPAGVCSWHGVSLDYIILSPHSVVVDTNQSRDRVRGACQLAHVKLKIPGMYVSVTRLLLLLHLSEMLHCFFVKLFAATHWKEGLHSNLIRKGAMR